MKKYLGILFILSPLFAVSQDSLAARFIQFTNEYNTDSLEPLLSDDFTLKRTFASYENDKESFLGNYMRLSKAWNAKFIILKTIRPAPSVQYLVEDQSDYLKYLGIKNPYWKVSVSVAGGKVTAVQIDTIANSMYYFAELKRKSEMFTSWMNKEYPGELEEKIYVIPGHMVRRLKEFAGLEDSH